jgi:hypothetical protein
MEWDEVVKRDGNSVLSGFLKFCNVSPFTTLILAINLAYIFPL